MLGTGSCSVSEARQCFGYCPNDGALLVEEAHLDGSDGRFVGLADRGASCVDSFWPCGGRPDDAGDRFEGSVDHAGVPDRRDEGVADLDEVVRSWLGLVHSAEIVARRDESRLCPAGDPDGPSGYPVCCEGGRGAHHLTRDDLHEDPAYCAASRATGVVVPGLLY
jgi:hypothetical protein